MAHYAGPSLYTQQAMLDASGGSPWVMPSLFMALDTTEAGVDDAGAVEVTNVGTGYVRQPVTLAGWALGQRISSAIIDFPVALVAYGSDVVAFRLMDNATYGLGNIIFRGPCGPKTIDVDDFYRVLAGNLIVRLPQKVT